MLDVAELREVFAEKLRRTNNMDAAFVKAVWVAYQKGLEDAKPDSKPTNSGEARGAPEGVPTV